MPQPTKSSSRPVSAAVQPHLSSSSEPQIDPTLKSLPKAHVSTEETALIQSPRIQVRASDGSEMPDTASWGPKPDATATAPPPRSEPSLEDTPNRRSVETDVASVEKITSLLRLASLFIPEARLVFYSHYPTGKDIVKDSAIVHHLPTDTEKNISCVVQRTQDVDFTFDAQIGDPSRPSQPLNLKFQVIYDPGSDQCLFVNKALEAVCLTSIAQNAEAQFVVLGQKCVIQPGVWKISRNTTEDRLIEFLLCKRQYTFSISQKNDDAQVEQASSDSQNIERSAKRRKLSANTSTTTATLKKDYDSHYTKWVQMFISFQKGRRNTTDIALPDLPNGGIATIQTPLSQTIFQSELSASTYQLKRIKGIATTSNTIVFSCQHSIHQDVAVKVLQYNNRSLDSLAHSGRLWQKEKDILLKLKHRNIVSLEAFDGRFFSLYLELLPLSLNRGLDSPFSLFEASIILTDISSALICLEKHHIAHNDIKPNNIAFSFSRGAVLFDFGIASSSTNIQSNGTPWYIPPEFEDDQRCGLAGDMWAFGVTMLYVLKKTQMPEKMTKSWNIRSAKNPKSKDNKQMKQWLKTVANARASLDQTDIIEDLVFQMLDSHQASRIAAAKIKLTLGRE